MENKGGGSEDSGKNTVLNQREISLYFSLSQFCLSLSQFCLSLVCVSLFLSLSLTPSLPWWHVSETNAGVRNTGRRSTYVIPGVTRFGMFQKLRTGVRSTYVIPGVLECLRN